MVQKPRVVITGLGAIAPNGIGKDAYWESLIKGRSGIRRITQFDVSQFPCHIAGEVVDFQPAAYIAPRELKRMSRVSQFATVVAKMALHDSAVEVNAANAPWIGVCFGTSLGKGEVFENEYPAFLERGVRGIHPLTLPQFAGHGLSSQVAIELGVTGLCSSMATGCTVGLDAIQWSYMQICQGRAKMMVVGSAEALITPFAFGAVCATGVLSRQNAMPESASRPFDLRRDGLVMSEGAGALVLEGLDHAEERQAPIYAEVLGAATARDGNDLVHCDVSGAGTARVMEIALYQSQRSKSCIDYINAHGVGLRDYDTAETSAIKTVFGKRAYHIPVSSIKSMIGQPFAAGGSLQVVASCLTLQRGYVPPTINYETPDPTCDLDYVPQHARAVRVRALLVHAHGMGGTDSALVLGKLDGLLE